MQTHSFDGLDAEFRQRKDRATSAARRYREAKEIRDAATTAAEPTDDVSVPDSKARRGTFLRPIRALLGGLLLVTACVGGAEVVADPVPSETATSTITVGGPDRAPLLYPDCHRGNPPQVC